MTTLQILVYILMIPGLLLTLVMAGWTLKLVYNSIIARDTESAKVVVFLVVGTVVSIAVQYFV